MISNEDKEKIRRMDYLEGELSWQNFVLPGMFIFVNLAFLAKFLITHSWELNAFIIVMGVLGIILIAFRFKGRKAKKQELANLKRELNW